MKNFTAIEVYVAHIGGSVMCIGTKEQCQSHKEAQPFNTDCWNICDVESFGEQCFESGYDSGHDSGYDSSAYHNS